MKQLTIMLALSIFLSCQKQAVQRFTIPEQVSKTLLEQYIDYELAVERLSKWGKPITKLPSRPHFDAMIDNFLKNERNVINRRRTMARSGGQPIKTEAPTEPYDNGVSCIGKFHDANSITTIVFTAKLDDAQTTITNSAFAFGGIGATWTPVGGIEQGVYDGVITYKQYYQEQYQIPGTNGVSETQLYVMYGNVYDGGCTVYGMQIHATSN